MSLGQHLSTVKDAWAMARAAGVAGTANWLLLGISFMASKWAKRPLVWARPAAISIEPTTSCNLRCPECISGTRTFTRKTGMLDPAQFRHFAQSMRPSAFYLNLYFQGEPFLNPAFLQMVATARTFGYYTATSTNGHYLTPDMCRQVVASGLNRLVVSIDGTTQETYKKYRVGGTLAKVVQGLENLRQAKKEAAGKGPFVIFQFIVFAHNEHQIADASAMAKDLGVNAFVLKTAQLNDLANSANMLPTAPEHSRYVAVSEKAIAFRNELSDHCWRMWSGLVVSWDGLVLPCCFDKDASHAVGNLTEQSFASIWKSDKYQRFRAQLFTDRSSIDICQNCTEGHQVFAA